MSETPVAAEPALTDEALKVVIVDQSRDAQDEARDLADARLDRELGEGGRFKKFLNGIWKGNIAKDYYRQKYVHQALETIQGENNVLSDLPADRRTRALQATIDRFQSEYDEVIHTEAGEKREVQSEDSQLAANIKHLVRGFVEGNLNAATLHEERTRLLTEYRKEYGEEALGKGLVTVDNLLEIAQAVAGAVEHGESLDHTLGRLQVITGEARNGARTEARYNAVDKGIDWLSKRKITSIVTPGTLAVGVAAAASIARVGSHSVVGAVTKTLLPGAAAGLWAGLRENKRTKDERSQHAREMATGGNFQEGDTRREEMEATRYETISATDLIVHLQEVGEEEVLARGSDAVQAALDALAAVQARVQISDSEQVDLISYSEKADVGEERMMLDLARREVRLALEAGLTEEVRTELSIQQDRTVKELIDERAAVLADVLRNGTEENEGMTAKDKAFAKLKRRRVATAAAIGVATGVAGGLVVQEAVAGFDPTRFGLIDMIRGEEAVPLDDGLIHQTVLEGMVRGGETTVHTDASTTFDSYDTATNGNIELSDDHTLETKPDGTISLIDGEGRPTVEGLVVDDNGTLDQASLDKLDAAGMVVQDKSFNTTEVSQTTTQVSAEQYIQNHQDEATRVTRDLWYGNDTPNIYDENELRVYRGGAAEAPGIIDGGYQYSVAGMTPEGSWQGGESVDWNQAAASGNLFVAVSGTFESQDTPFMIPIGPDGTVNIPADSPAGQFFANEDNAVAFNGAYMEIVQSTGQDAEGVVHIRPLATLVGEGSVGAINDTITTETVVHHADYVITTNGYDTVQGNFTEMAPITPIASRRSMEALSIDERRGEYYYGGVSSERERAQIINELSPRLRGNPDARLNTGEETAWFREEVRRRHGDDYVRDFNTFIDNDPAMQRINGNIESIVTIPVGAAFESENIYGTLSLYAQQDPEGLGKSVVLLNVNWLDTAMDNPEQYARIQKTIAEIDRAKRDFPNLAISSMMKEYSQEQAESTGGVIGYVMEDLVNMALLTAQRKIETGVMQSDHELVLVRGDADAKGLSRTLLRNFQNTLNGDQNLDVLKGAIRYGAEESKRFPGYGIVSSLMTSFQILATQDNVIHTGGINFGVRASTLAAVGGLGEMLVEGDDGKLARFTGAGSDDVLIGRRVSIARQAGRTSSTPGSPVYLGYSGASVEPVSAIKRVKLVAGAVTDTSADRLLPAYLTGSSPHNVWNPGLATGYAAGPGGYRDRSADADIVANAEKENLDKEGVYSAIEDSMSLELSWASESAARKLLAVYFASAPGAYRVVGRFGERGVRFKLTSKGREFIKHRIERETNGRFGPYGMRKMRQLYGVTEPGAKRQPASPTPPLVSPLA